MVNALFPPVDHFTAATPPNVGSNGGGFVALSLARPGAKPRRLVGWSAVFASMIAADMLLFASHLPAILKGELINPDSYMRVVRLRDGLASGFLADDVARDGVGANIHWSHLLDLIILLLHLPLRLFTNTDGALQLAAAAIGPISLGLIGVALLWAVEPLADGAWRVLGAALALISPTVISYALPGVAHHHALVAAVSIVIAGAAGRAAFGDARAARLLGLACGVGIWLTPEAMLFALMGFGAVLIGWLRQDAPGHIARTAGLAFLAVIAMAYVIDPSPAGWLSAEIDRMSIVWLVLAIVASASGAALAIIDRTHPPLPRRALTGFGFVMVGFLVWLAMFPNVVRGPSGLMSAAQATAFFGPISEMRPLTSLREFLGFSLGGAISVIGALAMAWRGRSLLWLYAAGCGLLIVALGIMHRRFTTYAEIQAMLMLPVMLTHMVDLRLPRWSAPMLRMALVLAFVAAPAGGVWATTKQGTDTHSDAETCSVREMAGALRQYPGAVVLGRIDDSPEMLWWSDVRTVGSLYHRGIDAYMRARALWRERDFASQPPLALRAAGVSLIAMCPARVRPGYVADLPEDTFYDALRRDRPPSWLSLAAAPSGSGYLIYKVVR